MTKTFRDLALLPITFLLALVSAVGFSLGSWTPLIGIALLAEHLFRWNSGLSEDSPSDFRSFFADQYTKYIYSIVILVLGLFAPFLWSVIGFWFLFVYPANFIVLRSFAREGVERLTAAAPRQSKVISLDNNIWIKNKTELRSFLSTQEHTILAEKISEKIDYSSYLRSTQASVFLRELFSSPRSDSNKLLEKLDSKM